MQNAATIPTETAPKTRRRRRTREDVTERIRDAARQLFGERGYTFTTTKEIARLADVSETLLFRYYGDKATLFNEVVTGPFDRLMERFVTLHPDPADKSKDADARRFTRDVFELLEQHQEMFRALLLQSRDQPEKPFGGLDTFFEKSARYAARDNAPGFNQHIGVRLGLGMIAFAVFFQKELFTHDIDREELIQTLEYIIAKSLGGTLPD